MCVLHVHTRLLHLLLFVYMQAGFPNQIAESLLYKYKCLVNSFVEYRLHATSTCSACKSPAKARLSINLLLFGKFDFDALC